MPQISFLYDETGDALLVEHLVTMDELLQGGIDAVLSRFPDASDGVGAVEGGEGRRLPHLMRQQQGMGTNAVDSFSSMQEAPTYTKGSCRETEALLRTIYKEDCRLYDLRVVGEAFGETFARRMQPKASLPAKAHVAAKRLYRQ